MTTYEYKGFLIRVPDESKYIAIGPDGVIRAYIYEPNLDDEQSLIHAADATPAVIVNCKEGLKSVTELKKFEPIVINEIAAPNTTLYEVGDTLTLQTFIDEEKARSSEVHVVVSCYSPGVKPWTQVLQVKVNGLSIDNIILTTVTDILHQYHA